VTSCVKSEVGKEGTASILVSVSDRRARASEIYLVGASSISDTGLYATFGRQLFSKA